MEKTKKDFWKDNQIGQKALNLSVSYAPYLLLMAAGGPVGTIAGISLGVGLVASCYTAFIRHQRRRDEDRLNTARRNGAPESIRVNFEDVKNRMGIKRDIPLGIEHVNGNTHASPHSVTLSGHHMQNCSIDELRFMFAHELSHVKNRDVSGGVIDTAPVYSSMALGLGSVGLTLINSIGTLVTGGAPVGAMTCLALMLASTANLAGQGLLKAARSRIFEFRADKEAILCLGDVGAAERSLQRLDPFFDTPLTSQRISQFMQPTAIGNIRMNRIKSITARAGIPSKPR